MSFDAMVKIQETKWGDPLKKAFLMALADSINPFGEFTFDAISLSRRTEIPLDQIEGFWSWLLSNDIVFKTPQKIAGARMWHMDLEHAAFGELVS